MSERTAQEWLAEGKKYFHTDFHRAIACFSRAINLEPFNYVYYFNRGRKHLSADQFPQAMADFTMVLRLRPDDDESWHYRGVASFFLGEYDPAIRDFLTSISIMQKKKIDLLPPTVDWAWMACMRKGEPEAAEALLKKYIYPELPCEESDYNYKKRVLLYAGYTDPEQFEADIDRTDDVKGLTEYYGLSLYYGWVRKDDVNRRRCLAKVLAYQTFHHAFAYKLALMDSREPARKEV